MGVGGLQACNQVLQLLICHFGIVCCPIQHVSKFLELPLVSFQLWLAHRPTPIVRSNLCLGRPEPVARSCHLRPRLNTLLGAAALLKVEPLASALSYIAPRGATPVDLGPMGWTCGREELRRPAHENLA